MMNRYFKKHSAVFDCLNCGRKTRDVNGSNGGVGLCEDCEAGSEQLNGVLNGGTPEEVAQYKRDMHACFQRAVDKGGMIEDYTKTP
jgi:hypothetical protein